MRSSRVVNESRNAILASQAGIADNFWLRLRGLLGRPPLRRGEGLLITPCRGVHMLGMKYPIDVAFIDRDGVVVGVSEKLAPGAKSAWHRSARHALELPAGTLTDTGTRAGDRLMIEEVVAARAASDSRARTATPDTLSGTA